MNYLKVCWRDFNKITKIRYDEIDALLEIERASRHMRNKEVSIQEILHHFRQYEEQNWFRPYWLWPSIENLEEVKHNTCDFRLVDTKEKAKENAGKVIEVLLKAFRQIELVSLILRFVRPEYFGIFAPPVSYMLSMPSGENAVRTYLMYLNNLLAIQDQYGFSTICDTENALWVLQHRCGNGVCADKKFKQQFEQDEFMLKMRARNMTESLRLTISARLAKVLFDTENELAAAAGCYALERNVATLSQQSNVESTLKVKKPSLADRLQGLRKKGHRCLNGISTGQIRAFKKTRDSVSHGGPYNRDKMKELIDFALRIEKFLDEDG